MEIAIKMFICAPAVGILAFIMYYVYKLGLKMFFNNDRGITINKTSLLLAYWFWFDCMIDLYIGFIK